MKFFMMDFQMILNGLSIFLESGEMFPQWRHVWSSVWKHLNQWRHAYRTNWRHAGRTKRVTGWNSVVGKAAY